MVEPKTMEITRIIELTIPIITILSTDKKNARSFPVAKKTTSTMAKETMKINPIETRIRHSETIKTMTLKGLSIEEATIILSSKHQPLQLKEREVYLDRPLQRKLPRRKAHPDLVLQSWIRTPKASQFRSWQSSKDLRPPKRHNRVAVAVAATGNLLGKEACLSISKTPIDWYLIEVIAIINEQSLILSIILIRWWLKTKRLISTSSTNTK